MSDLTLHFKFHLLTDERGEPITDEDGNHQFVPVLRMAHLLVPPSQESAPKAYQSAEGWCNPKTLDLWYSQKRCIPPNAWEECMRNDILDQ